MEWKNQEKPFGVIWSKKALKNLNKIDRKEKETIIYKVDNKLAKDPYGVDINKGNAKQLKGKSRKDQWRYRTGNYRVIYKIFPKEVYIDILEVDDRKDIYD